MQSRISLFTVPGGDTVQICKTAEALQQRGVTCKISTELQPDLSGWDIVHLFNLTRPQEVYMQARNAQKQGKPIALSTIYLSSSDYDGYARAGAFGVVSRILPNNILEYLKVIARGVVNREWHAGSWALLKHGHHQLQNEVMRMTSVSLPNSHSEWKRVLRDFPQAKSARYVVVPNAVDENMFDSRAEYAEMDDNKRRTTVLCVANISPRKNQLRLIRALNGSDLPLVIAGLPTPNARGYYEQIKREAGPNVHFAGHVKQDDLEPYYRDAKVHVLASWMETTGLSSLEAGINGCNLVITDEGDTKEYFDDMAYYCDPGSETSIREAVLKAYAAPANNTLRHKIKTEYNWGKTAEATLLAYLQIIQ